jgi:superfamily II DNA/RNA helicase
MADDEEQSLAGETISEEDGDADALFRMPSFSLSKQLIANLERRGLTIPTAVQRQVIPKIQHSRGKDICVNAPTGSGKTLAYAVPITDVTPALLSVCLTSAHFSICQKGGIRLWGVSLSFLLVN